MKIRLMTIGRTQVLLHTATLFVALYMALCGRTGLFLAAMVSILLHEGAHSVAAWAMGECPAAVEITPLGAVMRLEDELRLPAGKRLVMLAAGPCATLLLCMLALVCTKHGILSLTAGRRLFMTNAGLLALNLLPCLPLDGGRLLSVGLEACLGAQQTRLVMRWLGLLIGGTCIVLSIFATWRTGVGQFTLAACGCVILYAARISTTTGALAELSEWMARKIRMEQRGVLPVCQLAVMEDTSLRQIITQLPHRAWVQLIILEKGTLRTLTTCDESLLIAAYMDAPSADCSMLVKLI